MDLLRIIISLSCTKNKVFHCGFLQFPADLVTFTEEILNEKLHFLLSTKNLKRLIVYATTGTGPYSDRCAQQRLTSCMSKDQNRGSVVQEGTGSTYESAGTFSHKVCHFDIW